MSKIGDETKQKLIDTAHGLLWSNGYGSVTVDGICKAAGIHKGSFYHHFKSKTDLTIATVDDYFENSKSEMDQIFSPSNTGLEQLFAVADLTYTEQKKASDEYGLTCGCPLSSLGSEMANQQEEIRKKINEILQFHIHYYESMLQTMVREKLIDEDANVKQIALDVFAYIGGQMTLARIQNDLDCLKCNLKMGLMRLIGIKKEMIPSNLTCSQNGDKNGKPQ